MMVVIDKDSIYLPKEGNSALQIAVFAGEIYDVTTHQPPVNTYDTSAIVPFYSGESQTDQIARITTELLGFAKSDIFQTNKLDLASRTNMGESPLTGEVELRAHYFATLDIDYQSIEAKSPKPTNLKDKAVKWIANKLGSEVTINLPETKVQALATVNVYERQEPPTTP